MLREDGREALEEVKADASLHCIPVVVFTTSSAEEEVRRSYDLVVSVFIRKPEHFEDLREIVEMVGSYWIEAVEPPPE